MTSKLKREDAAQGPHLVLKDTRPRQIPKDEVHFTVELCDDRCSSIPEPYATRAANLVKDGFTTTIDRIVAHAAIHFFSAAVDQGHGQAQAQFREAWEALCNWGMRGVAHDSRKRQILLVNATENSRVQGHRAEIFGVGLGLQVAINFFDKPYQLWRPTERLQPHDLEAPGQNGPVRVETRGRVDREAIGQAIEQIYKKFETPDYTRAIGVICCPRTRTSATTADIVIVDPVGAPQAREEFAQERAVLRHYLPFFADQAGWVKPFADRMRELANASDADFEQYLRQGDDVLRSSPSHRTSFFVGTRRFCGTLWQGYKWPSHLAAVDRARAATGAVYWGLWDKVIEAIRTGEIRRVVDMRVTQWQHVEERRALLVMPDATAFAWAASRQEANRRLFSDLE